MNKCKICKKILLGAKIKNIAPTAVNKKHTGEEMVLTHPNFLKRRATDKFDVPISIQVEKSLGDIVNKRAKIEVALKQHHGRLNGFRAQLYKVQEDIMSRSSHVIARKYKNLKKESVQYACVTGQYLLKFHRMTPEKIEAERIALLAEKEVLIKIKQVKSNISRLNEFKLKFDELYDIALREMKGIVVDKIILTEDNFAEENTKNSKTIISAGDIKTMKFDSIELSEYYQNLIGTPSKSFKMLIYGPAGGGKSSFALKFANYLASGHGITLYNASEEGVGLSLQRKLNEMKSVSEKLKIVAVKDLKSIMSILEQFKFVFLDSITEMNISDSDYSDLMKLDIGIISISQVTKSGSYRGSSSIAHDPDVIIEIKDYEAIVHKTRFK